MLNAIAHAKFRFDDAKKEMVFKDRATRTRREFSKSLSIVNFGKNYYGKIDSFCRLRLDYMLLLGVRDLARSPKLFGHVTLKPE